MSEEPAVNIDEIKAVLAKATPGPVHVAVYWSGNGPDEQCYGMLQQDDGEFPTGIIDENPAPGCSESLSHDLDLYALLHNTAPALIAELEALRAENGRLRDDACRYRWLRDVSVPPHNFYIAVPDEFGGVEFSRNEVDTYIDSARAALTGDSQ